MKTLSIQQPWATLICTGIKDVENRTWKPAEIPGKILIHASSAKVPKKFMDTIPLDWMLEIQQNILYGNIPELQEMPLSAIIGYATVYGFEQKTDSVWDGGPDCIKWLIKDMFLFDEPITGVKGKLGLFDYPIDEDNLPDAHRVELAYPELKGAQLVVPCCEWCIDELDSLDFLRLDMDLALINAVCNEDGSMKKIDTARMVSPTRSVSFGLENVSFHDHLAPDTDCPIAEENLWGEVIPWQCVEADIKR